MNSFARTALASCALALLGAAPPAAPSYGPVPAGPQTAFVKRYVDALRTGQYDAAYAMLSDDERAYFGSAAAYRSVFDADGFTIAAARIVGARGDERGRVYFVREQVGFVDHARDARRRADVTVPIGVLPAAGGLRIKDPGKPYRAFASTSAAGASGLHVTVKKMEFFEDRIAIVVTFANLGDRFITVLPYGKSVLRDDKGGVYRILALKNWAVTDKHLYEGVPLAPNAQYTGSLTFTASRLDPLSRTWSLTVAPALADGADAPFDVTVAVAPR